MLTSNFCDSFIQHIVESFALYQLIFHFFAESKICAKSCKTVLGVEECLSWAKIALMLSAELMCSSSCITLNFPALYKEGGGVLPSTLLYPVSLLSGC